MPEALDFQCCGTDPLSGCCSWHGNPVQPGPSPMAGTFCCLASSSGPVKVWLLLSLLQDFQSDPLHHLSTYLCLCLVIAEFVLSCLVDQPPFFQKDPQPAVSHQVPTQCLLFPYIHFHTQPKQAKLRRPQAFHFLFTQLSSKMQICTLICCLCGFCLQSL